ncbi:hypothetical protein B0H67DRAFT_482169 [Lasiosphaeris hirsuta]|uniref:EthD domain-containing protein n=1 Tax=Lasiosphaeris hirsuta TaxID=260670 RepID=A0AA40B1D1_9PEZI|nr:hypothetical protein B0H67DRAFT_482169 [Lasiosphaeris hirsuta]
MASSASLAPQEIQKKRLIRLTLAHYRNENCTEEEFYRFVTEEHAPHAAKIHARHGLDGYSLHWAPTSFRATAKAINAGRGDPWVIRDHDVQVEFLFRDMAAMLAVVADSDFQKLHEAEAPYTSRVHIEASLGWVETYVAGASVVNITAEGKPDYLGWGQMSEAPLGGGK